MSIEILIGIFVFLYGLVFGSFYNVIIYRLPIDMSIAKGGSICPHCKAKLKAIDLVPLFSWILLRGKCRYCKEKITIRYLIIELITGLLFLLAYAKFGISFEFMLYCSLWSMLLVTAIIDYDHMIICDIILVVFSVIGLISIVLLKNDLLNHFYGALAGFAIYFAIYFAAKIIYKKEAFGFGDVLLMCSIGLYLGLWNAILTSFLTFLVAMVFIIAFKIPFKKDGTKQEIPLGPSICIAAFIASLYGSEIIALYLSLVF